MDRLVLVPTQQPARIGEHREHELGLVPQRRHHGVEVRVAGRALDDHVELAVALGGGDEVTRRGSGAPDVDAALECDQIGVGAEDRGSLGGVSLDHAPQLEELHDLVGFDLRDVGATPWQHLDEAGALEGADRFTHRVARHAELQGETILVQALAGLELAAHDHAVDLVGDDLTQGAMGLAETHGYRIQAVVPNVRLPPFS